MLERVRLQPQTVKVDPLDTARAWNIPVYSVPEILKRLEHLCAKAGSSSKKPPGLKVLKAPYLKLETGFRPDFKQLKVWPSINLNTRRGETPFAPIQDASQRLNQKGGKDECEGERVAGGYCELCCCDYADLKSHVVTSRHLQLANDPDYYAQLDTLIRSTSFDSFIASQMCAGLARRCLRSGSGEGQCATVMGTRLSTLSANNTQSAVNGHSLRPRASTRSLDDTFAKRPLEVQCNGIINNHNHLTRLSVKSDSILGKESGLEYEGLTRRTRTISASYPGTNNELSQLSPTGSDITHHLRSRKQMWLPTSLLGTTAEDALNNSRLRVSRDYPTLDDMKTAQVKGTMKSPNILAVDDSSEKKLRSVGRDEEEKNHSKPAHECNNVDKSRNHDSHDEDNDSECKYGSKNKYKHEEEKSGKKKLKKKSLSRELVNLKFSDEKRKKVQKKRLSVEEKLIEDNKSYYKVEVLNSKLRSTGYYLSQSQRELEMSKTNGNEGCVTQNCSEPLKSEIKSEEKEPVVVRFKKVRQTELSLLSDEAESFMFGEPSRRESSVSTESSEEDDEVSVKLESDEHDRIVTRIKKEVVDENSVGSCSLASSSSSRRKRKSPDESVIRDNAEYYKFESTGSRLRFHSNLFPPTPDNKEVAKVESGYGLRSDSKNLVKVKLDENDFEPESTVSGEKPVEERSSTCKYGVEDFEFSFEKAPTHEPWYQTFKRQDECREYYYPSYSSYPRVMLPYEYPSYLIKRIRVAAVNEKGRWKKRKKKEVRVQQIIQDDKPRKSPRCHASTLAIMSSLKRRRPRDSPNKKSELPSSELSLASSEVIQDEESRCSTIIDPPSVAPSDSLTSFQTPVQRIPEIRIDHKSDLGAENKKIAEEIKIAAENIEDLFTNVCCENDDDLLAHMLDAFRKEVESSPAKDCSKKGKGKGKSSAPKSEPTVHFGEAVTCLPVDPEILVEEQPDTSLSSGPTIDVLSLIDGYRSCSSMERADYEHMNPHAVDALRVLIADSCNSSDCGGSSACDYSFLEDGKICKRRKKKKRNLTGWPVNHKRKFMKKSEELSTVVLRRNCRAKDKIESESVKESTNEPVSEKALDSEVVVKLKKDQVGLLSEVQEDSVDSDVKADSVQSDFKACSTISRTTSVDSSSIKSFDVQSCYIKVKKMPEDCLDTLSRCLRSSETSSSRRATCRKAKLVGRESLRRCR